MTIAQKHDHHKNSPLSQRPSLPSLRVLIADDHPVVCIGVRNMLSAESAIRVVGEAADGNEAIEQTRLLRPDILLLDLFMPRLSGLEAMQRITAELPAVKIILISGEISAHLVIEALQTGARGILLKDTLTEHMTRAILTVASGDYWIGSRRVTNLASAIKDLHQKAAQAENKTFGLTPREMEVVSCIIEGCSNREIAKRFGLSEETVKRHLSNIYDKTGVSTRLELAIFTIAHNMLPPAS